MLKAIRNAVRRAYGDQPLDPVEFYANLPLAKAVTPDDIIAASVIQSFAKEFDQWKAVGSGERTRVYVRPSNVPLNIDVPTLRLNKDAFTVLVRSTEISRDKDDLNPWVAGPTTCTVDGVQLSQDASERILTAWNTIAERVRYLKETAAKAKADMEANERKWNVAEQLLGMKRNEFGALVPTT